MTTAQRYEIEAWLGDDHGLTDNLIDELTAEAGRIADRYPDPDDEAERQAALTIAYRLMVTDGGDLVAELSHRLLRARLELAETMAATRQAAVTLVDGGDWSEAGIARDLGVDRQAVREWRGKRFRKP